MHQRAKRNSGRKKLECINGSLLTVSLTVGPHSIPTAESMDLAIMELLSEEQWTEIVILDTGMASLCHIGAIPPNRTKDTISVSTALVTSIALSSSLNYGAE